MPNGAQTYAEAAKDLLKTPSGTIRLITIGLLGLGCFAWYGDRKDDRKLKADYFSQQVEVMKELKDATVELTAASLATAEFQHAVTTEHEQTESKIDANGLKLDALLGSVDQTNKLLGVVITLLEKRTDG